MILLPFLVGLDATRLPPQNGVLLKFDLHLLALREPLLSNQGVLHLRLVYAACGCQRVAHYIYITYKL